MSKVYSEKEAAEILQQAVKLQEAAGEAGETYTPGITVDELRRIGEEAGLDPKYLDLALAKAREPDPPKKWFMNLTQEHERVIEGELPPDSFDVILEGLGKTHRKMALRQVGRAVEGQVMKGWGFGWLQLSSRRGRTRLNLRSNCFVPFMTSLYPALIIGAVTAAGLSERGYGAIGIAVLLAFLGAGFGVFRYGLKKAHETFAKLADDLEDRIVEENAALRNELARPATTVVDEERTATVEDRVRTSSS